MRVNTKILSLPVRTNQYSFATTLFINPVFVICNHPFRITCSINNSVIIYLPPNATLHSSFQNKPTWFFNISYLISNSFSLLRPTLGVGTWTCPELQHMKHQEDYHCVHYCRYISGIYDKDSIECERRTCSEYLRCVSNEILMVCVDIWQLDVDEKSHVFFSSNFAILGVSLDNSLHFVS